NHNAAQVWDAKTGESFGQFETESGREIEIMNFTADGSTLMLKVQSEHNVADQKVYTGTIVLWDVAAGEEKKRFDIPNDSEAVFLSPDGAILAVTEDVETELGTERGV